MEITFESIIGKHMLVGITYLDRKGNIINMIQFDGEVIEADENKCIKIKKSKSGEIVEFPPILSAIQLAAPGEYKLRSTGEVVINPDLISTWIMEQRRYK